MRFRTFLNEALPPGGPPMGGGMPPPGGGMGMPPGGLPGGALGGMGMPPMMKGGGGLPPPGGGMGGMGGGPQQGSKPVEIKTKNIWNILDKHFNSDEGGADIDNNVKSSAVHRSTLPSTQEKPQTPPALPGRSQMGV